VPHRANDTAASGGAEPVVETAGIHQA